MRLLAIDVADHDPDLVSDRCWAAGAEGIWEADVRTWRVGVREDDVASFLAAVADLSPRDVTDAEAIELATRDVAVGSIELSVPPTVFGDGSHPTTTGCLDAVAAVVRAGRSVLDVGCGTGILAVAAARAGATVTAIDIDPVAVAATSANAATNGVTIDASTTPLSELPGPFDVVIANITAGSIRPLLADLVRLTALDGVLVVSGILDEQWSGIRADLGNLAAGRPWDASTAVDAGWVTATLRRG